jgi:hypothetical protein
MLGPLMEPEVGVVAVVGLPVEYFLVKNVVDAK